MKNANYIFLIRWSLHSFDAPYKETNINMFSSCRRRTF